MVGYGESGMSARNLPTYRIFIQCPPQILYSIYPPIHYGPKEQPGIRSWRGRSRKRENWKIPSYKLSGIPMPMKLQGFMPCGVSNLWELLMKNGCAPSCDRKVSH